VNRFRSRERAKPQFPAEPGVLRGVARVDTRTKNLIARIQPGEIAIIDHEDIDRIAAEGLIQRRVRVVLNAARSSSGRYPNLGPLLLVSAGVPLIDDIGPSVMSIPDGAVVTVDKGRVFIGEADGKIEMGRGETLTLELTEERLDSAKQGIATEIERFAENTIGYIKDERDVLLEVTRLPEVATDFHGRHVLVVVRGYDYKEDLGALRSYIRETRPLLIGVDGGADALLDFGHRPDIIIGDMDSVTTEALLSGAELIVHAYPGGMAPGHERLEALNLDSTVFEAPGTSEDIALLLAFERGAELIVAVGTHANMIEFLDKGRKGMASTFLTRLRVGPILVDAKGVSRLYRGRVRRRDVMLLVGSGLVTMAMVVALSDPMQVFLATQWLKVVNWWFDVQQAVFS
jgi:uncharacterized membrane-anchored protein